MQDWVTIRDENVEQLFEKCKPIVSTSYLSKGTYQGEAMTFKLSPGHAPSNASLARINNSIIPQFHHFIITLLQDSPCHVHMW